MGGEGDQNSLFPPIVDFSENQAERGVRTMAEIAAKQRKHKMSRPRRR